MPNRYVRESAIESEAVNCLSWQGEVFYRRLINRVDDFGRFTGHLDLLRASIFPLQLHKVSSADVERLLGECQAAGLVFRYAVSGKAFIVLNNWEKGRAKHSEYPEPPIELCDSMRTYVYTRSQMSPIPTPTPTPSPAPGAESAGTRVAKPPALSEVIAAGARALVEKEICDAFFHRCEARPLSPAGEWTDRNGTAIRNWQAALMAFASSWRANQHDPKSTPAIDAIHKKEGRFGF